LQGLQAILAWPAAGFMVLGVFIGIWMGAVPGLGGVLGMILLLPFTFEMEPVHAFALLLGLFAVTSTSDTIASVMLGIPGTAASQATILDGYPLAKKGQAARAFGAAFTVSAFGGVFGAIVLAVSLPMITPIITSFGSPEIFMLALLGLTMVGSLSGGSISKGVAAALFGLLISTIGVAQTASIYRYTFGTDYLLDNLPLIPVVLGLFAIPELMELATKNVNIARVKPSQSTSEGIILGIKDAVKNWWLATRCAAIGTYIGILPGLGAAIVDWVAYGHAVQSSKNNETFGKGDIRGVIAPEAANNATKGGALIPAVAFGIPGSLGTAILLGALLMVGLLPGPDMLTTDLHITFSMVWTIVFANILAAGLLMIWANQVAKIAFVSGHLIVPAVILFVFMGAWLGGGVSLGSWVTVLLFGVIGYVMKVSGWARPPLILGLILGTIVENRFLLSTGAYDGFGWLAKPLVLFLLILVLVTVFLAVRGFKGRRGYANSTDEQGEGRVSNPVMSLPFALVLVSCFVYATITAAEWPEEVGLFPIVVAVPGLMLAGIACFKDVQGIRDFLREKTTLPAVLMNAFNKATLARSSQFVLLLVGMIVLMLIVGQKLALPIFIYIYLVWWGKKSQVLSLTYALFGWGLLVFFYDRIINLVFHVPLLQEPLEQMTPSGFPIWVLF
jgi:putative tricarboxylic transport membrane protein